MSSWLPPTRSRISAATLQKRYQEGERNFRDVDIKNAVLAGCNLSGIDLCGADLRGTNLSNTILRNANLCGCKLGRCTKGWKAWLSIGLYVTLSILLSGMMSIFGYLLYSLSLIMHQNFWTSVSFYFVLALYAFTLFHRGFNKSLLFIALIGSISITIQQFITPEKINPMTLVFYGTCNAILISAIGDFGFILESIAVYGNIWGILRIIGQTIFFVYIFNSTVTIASFSYTTAGYVIGWYLRQRILRDNTRDSWLNALRLFFAQVGGTKFYGADLTDADLTGLWARGSDFNRACLMRTRFAGTSHIEWANFSATDLELSCVQRLAITLDGVGQDFSGLRLAGISLRGAKLANAILSRCNLAGADLRGADLTNADLTEALLVGAQLQCARLTNAKLQDADLRGANLSEILLENAVLTGMRVNANTFTNSNFSDDELVALHELGARIVEIDAFPEDLRNRLLSTNEGLTLCFNTRLIAFDRYLVDGTIFGVLGRETDCQVRNHRQSRWLPSLRGAAQSGLSITVQTCSDADWKPWAPLTKLLDPSSGFSAKFYRQGSQAAPANWLLRSSSA